MHAHSKIEPKPGTGEAVPSPRAIAERVLRTEAEAIVGAMDRVGPSFDTAVELFVSCEGAVLVSGVGKSGLVGQKLSATLASTGTPSHFLSAAEAAHGDLGRFRPGDVGLLLSYSGATAEVIALAGQLSAQGVPFVSISRDEGTRLAKLSTAALTTGELEEACQHNLAPSASTAAMMALGDALALAASEHRAFSADDFHQRHPGGALGAQLLPVESVVRFRAGENLAPLSDRLTVGEVIVAGSTPGVRSAGATLLVDEHGRLTGIFTDGDLRRLMARVATKGGPSLELPIGEVMTRTPAALGVGDRVREAVRIVRERRIDEIPVLDANRCPVGLLDVQDLIALRVLDEGDATPSPPAGS